MIDFVDDQLADSAKEVSDTKIAIGFLGLSGTLWRLALVTGIAQFSMSVWVWEFSIYLETFLVPWQIGLTFTVSTLASLIGYISSGTIADFIGRKKTMAVAFLPMITGLIAISLNPAWPFIPFEYGLVQFGWSFLIIMSRAIPADEIAATGGHDAARRFTMVLMPAFLLDGLSPILGATMISLGFVARDLHLLGSIGAIIAFISTLIFVRESLQREIIDRAKTGPLISFRRLGNNFWKLVVGMISFTFFFNAALPYWGNLVVGEWGVSETHFGYAWSAFSLTTVLLMYTASGLADRNIKGSLLLAVIWNALMILIFSLIGGGLEVLIILNIVWSLPVVLWIGAERALVVADIEQQDKGRALGTYQFLMTSTNVAAQPFGAMLWTITGSLRTGWLISGIGGLLSATILVGALKSMRGQDKTENNE
ncbi:MAG: hypothetical protein ACFE7R_09860 [Candidatus Hodarchaeota archaeon]